MGIFKKGKKMKSKFKIGDWVRSKGSEINSQNSELLVKQLKNQIQIDKFITPNIDEWELWTPKKGEWCWVSDFNYKGSIPELRQFSRMEGENKVFFKENGMEEIYLYVEPFVYDLPNIVKG